MSQEITGTISTLSEKPWSDRKTGKQITLYSFQIEEDNRWFRTGTDAIQGAQGDTITFRFDPQANNAVDFRSVRVSAGTGAAPAPRGKSAVRPRAASSTSAKDKYWEDKDQYNKDVVEPRITISAAQRDAITLIAAALDNDALSFGQATKGKKLDMLLDYVDQVAERFYNQRMGVTLAKPPAAAAKVGVRTAEAPGNDDPDYEFDDRDEY